MTPEIEQYIFDHSDAEPALLHELERQTHLRTIQPRMCSGLLQGSLLKTFVQMLQPELTLEIGTFTGYSALSMAQGLTNPDARIHTVEVNDELEDLIMSFFSRSVHAHQLVLHIGSLDNALAEIEAETGGKLFDLVFIDADKREYLDYYEAVLPRVRKGGFILADNVLWDGHVVDAVVKSSDRHTAAVKAFNDHVAADRRVEKFILPIRDGMTIIRKL